MFDNLVDLARGISWGEILAKVSLMRSAENSRNAERLKEELKAADAVRAVIRRCISAAPAALDRYLAALPAMSLIPFAPFA